MRVAFVLLVLAVVVLAVLPLARAEGGPREQFDAAVGQTLSTVESANQRVLHALAGQDWNAWNQTHDAYNHTLVRAVPEIERAISSFMLGTLKAGGQLSGPTLQAIDDAAEEAARFAKQRVITGAYATLTRRGVRPDSRGAALKLLEKQGVYALDGIMPGTATLMPQQGLGESPLTGRVPKTTEAGEYLSKWQFAYMSAQALGPRIRTYESEIADLPADAPNRADIQARLEEARTNYQQLLQAIQDYRVKYYASGGS